MKKQAFYVFDEHTDYVHECIKIGMKPISGDVFVKEFLYDGTIYRVLSVHECYSGWEITVMALPCMDFDQLTDTLSRTKIYDEIVGCLGILLKKYLDGFIIFLSKGLKDDRNIRKIKRIILNEIAGNSEQVSLMEQLLDICRQ